MQQRNVKRLPSISQSLEKGNYFKEKLVILLPVWDQYVKWTHHFFSSVSLSVWKKLLITAVFINDAMDSNWEQQFHTIQQL